MTANDKLDIVADKPRACCRADDHEVAARRTGCAELRAANKTSEKARATIAAAAGQAPRKMTMNRSSGQREAGGGIRRPRLVEQLPLGYKLTTSTSGTGHGITKAS